MADEYMTYDVDEMLAAETVRKAEDLLDEPTFFQTGDDPGAYTDKGQELHKAILFAMNYSRGLREYMSRGNFSIDEDARE